MNNVLFDLEATCWTTLPLKQMETIEIGAVKVNEEGELIDEFNLIIKPLLFPELSNFCKTLTGITQEQVDNGVIFPAAISDFKDWCEGSLIWSWGDFDRKQLRQDGMLWGVDVTFVDERHKNLSVAFRQRNGGKKCGIVKALRKKGMEFEGTLHSGLDDARNIARIFIDDMEWYVNNV